MKLPQFNRTTKLLVAFGFLYAFFLGQGVPLWDDDFTSWFWKIKDKSILHYFFELISPISTQPQYWGFNERPIQALVYKIFYLISGYDSWSYFIYKDVICAGLVLMIYKWSLKLVPETIGGNIAAAAAAIFFVFSPGLAASHIIHSDLATTAELLFLVITYLIWTSTENTPEDWSGWPNLREPVQRKWLLKWIGISGLTYLSYKSKADLKVIPFIFAAYVLLISSRRKQFRFFLIPFFLMLLLAIPWGPGIFSKLPPFIPGSKGSEIGWMWQPASGSRVLDFLWSSEGKGFFDNLLSPTLSLSGILGPFLLLVVLAFLVWRMEAFDKVRWTTLRSSTDRARTFVFIWLAVIIAAISALPAINYVFRVRYGIIPMIPVSLLLAWIFGLFSESVKRLPKWAFVIAIAAFVIQSGVNFIRAVQYRKDIGRVMTATDQVYAYVGQKLPMAKLALMPDFRPYDYHPDGGEIFKKKTWLKSAEQLNRDFKPYETYVISWNASLWDQLELVENFTGCKESTIFDKVFPCRVGTGTFLMRYIGREPLYIQGEELRNKGKLQDALRVHQELLAKHPFSLAGHFVVGLLAYQLKNWELSRQSYSILERYFPEHLSILYNHALALKELGFYNESIRRLEFIRSKDLANYPNLINLYYSYKKAEKTEKAKAILKEMRRLFPQDKEVIRLINL